jgi:hypothetical protein
VHISKVGQNLKVNVCQFRTTAYIACMLRARLHLGETMEAVPPGFEVVLPHLPNV